MRWVIRAICLGILCLSRFELQAQQDIALIPVASTDATLSEWHNYVLDVHSGEQFYKLDDKDKECPDSISPDGKWLIYRVGGNLDTASVWMINFASKEKIPLRQISFAMWSDDGHSLAYSASDDAQTSDVYVYDVTAHEEQLVEKIGVESISHIVFQWIGNSLIYAFQDDSKLYLHRFAANQLEQLSFDLPPKLDRVADLSLSPDGSFVSIAVVENQMSQIYVLDTSLGNWKQISNTEMGGQEARWSPDGQYLAFVTVYDPNDVIQENAGDIYLWSKDTGELRLFNDSPDSRNDAIDWSPDGRYISFRENYLGGTQAPRYDLLVKAIDSDETEYVKSFVDLWAGDMRWISPTEIVYTYAYSELSFDSPDKQNDLYRYDLTTHESTRLTDTPGSEFFGCVSG